MEPVMINSSLVPTTPLAFDDATRVTDRLIIACVSGSFRKFMPKIYAAVYELRSYGISVLSPQDPVVVDDIDEEFLFVRSDPTRSVKLVEDRHLLCISPSYFLWFLCENTSIGPSG